MRIAIVRLTSLGDVVHTLPVAAALRRHRPGDHIIWIVEEHEQVLVRDNPVVDEIVVVPLRRWLQLVKGGRPWRAAREMRDAARRLKALGADTIIDVQGWGHKTSPIVAATHAPTRVGFARGYARDVWSTLFTTVHVTPPPAAVHVVDQNLALLGPLGINDARATFVLPRWPGAAARVDGWLADHHIADRSPIALLPSTRGPKKLWPAQSYSRLGAALAEETGLPVVFAGGPIDKRVLEAVEGAAPPKGLFTYAPDEVGELSALLGRAALVIGNDTGPLHLAAAAEVPTLGLFGPTSGARNGPYGRSSMFIQSPTRSMRDIPVEAVLEKARRMLAERNVGDRDRQASRRLGRD